MWSQPAGIQHLVLTADQLSPTYNTRLCVYSVKGETFSFIMLARSLLYFISGFLQSCHHKLIELFSGKLYLIGLAALVVAVIMVSVRLKI